MAFDIYGNHLRRGYCEVHPDVHEEHPCSVCMEEQYRPREPEPERDEHEYFLALCDAEGHPYHGCDNEGPRCYCGERREFTEDEMREG